MKTQGSK
jgi:hypothetical protein